jgi:hypothetical protein
MVVTTGITNVERMGLISTLGQGGGCMCHCNQEKDGDSNLWLTTEDGVYLFTQCPSKHNGGIVVSGTSQGD